MAKIDDVGSALLDHIVGQGGEVQAEPGRLLAQLAEVTGYTYGQVRVAVRYLESIELVQVERLTDPVARQHNMVCRIELAP